MGKMKLMPMTDFVLERYPKNPQGYQSRLFADTVLNYARFLKQPLALWMFVPCDDAGNVLSTDDSVVNSAELVRKVTAYREAKEKVLFEGWNCRRDKGFPGFTHVYDEDFSICLDTLDADQYVEGGCLDFKLKGNTIDAMANAISDVSLTPAALKQIFG